MARVDDVVAVDPDELGPGMAAATISMTFANSRREARPASASVGTAIAASCSTVTSRSPPRSSATIAGPLAANIALSGSGNASQPSPPTTSRRKVSPAVPMSASAAAKSRSWSPSHQRRKLSESMKPPPSRRDREQVEHDRRGSDDQRAEGEEHQRERKEQHEAGPACRLSRGRRAVSAGAPPTSRAG